MAAVCTGRNRGAARVRSAVLARQLPRRVCILCWPTADRPIGCQGNLRKHSTSRQVLAPATNGATAFGALGHRRSWKREEITPRLCWLERRAAEHGFQVDQVAASVDRVFIRKDKRFWLDETTFTGRSTVVDADRFAAALTAGEPESSTSAGRLPPTFRAKYLLIADQTRAPSTKRRAPLRPELRDKRGQR